MKINILYVDDEINNLRSFNANFRKRYNLFLAESGKEGLEILKNNDIHIIISDQKMPEMSGTNFLTKARQLYPDPVRIIITAHSDKEVIKEAINTVNIFKWLDKPFNDDEINHAINDAYDAYKYGQEAKEVIEKLNHEEIPGAPLTQKQVIARLIIQSFENLN